MRDTRRGRLSIEPFRRNGMRRIKLNWLSSKGTFSLGCQDPELRNIWIPERFRMRLTETET